MKTKPYKFAVGEEITYTYLSHEQQTCNSCGNTHDNEIKELRTSTIVSRNRIVPSDVYQIPSFTVQPDFKVLPDGTKEYYPYMTRPEPELYMYNNYTLEDGSAHLEHQLNTH